MIGPDGGLVARQIRRVLLASSDVDDVDVRVTSGGQALVLIRPAAVRNVPSPEDVIAAWTSVFDASLSQDPSRSVTFNTAGWIDSRTGGLIPDIEMRDWLRSVLEVLLPLARRKSVLEIGTGSGLLAHRIARVARAYTGTDISYEAVAMLSDALTRRDGAESSFLHQQASDWSRLDGPFDVIILNSVVQYFPSEAYLRIVLDEALLRLAAGGVLFVGDVRNLALDTRYREWRGQPAGAPWSDTELRVHPQYFLQYANPTRLRVLPKLSRYANEMSMFRYNALIRRDEPSMIDADAWLPGSGMCTAADVIRAISNCPDIVVGMTGIPQRIDDGRLGLGPMAINSAATRSQRLVQFSLLRGDSTGAFDAFFDCPRSRQPLFPCGHRTGERLTSDPRFDSLLRRLESRLIPKFDMLVRAELGDSLPELSFKLVA